MGIVPRGTVGLENLCADLLFFWFFIAATFERYARIFPEFHDSSGGGDGNASKPRGREQRLTISYRLDGENVTLDLWRNDEIVAPEGHFLLLQSASGETHRKQLAEHELERCQYHVSGGEISSKSYL